MPATYAAPRRRRIERHLATIGLQRRCVEALADGEHILGPGSDQGERGIGAYLLRVEASAPGHEAGLPIDEKGIGLDGPER